MRYLSLLLLSLITFGTLAAQSIEDIVQEGIEYHDLGDFDKAIETYKKALKIDPNSDLAHYELSLSYISIEDYKKAIRHTDKVLAQDSKYKVAAYINKGSALDLLGQTKKSIALFEDAIKTQEPHYLLYYNLALNYFKINDLDNAEVNTIQAILTNPGHATSHLLLANIHAQKDNTVQTLLPAYYFLFLEPNSQRSIGAYQLLRSTFSGNVTKDNEKPNTINITLSPNSDSKFGAAELMLSMLEASNSLEENKDKSDEELFAENTKSFFIVLGEIQKEESEEIWWTYYTPLFYKIAKSDHIKTFCKYIGQSQDENYNTWLEANQKKLETFGDWLGSL